MVDNLTPCQEVSLAAPAGRKKRRGRDGEAAAARQRAFPRHPPLNAPLTREQAQVEAKLWEIYLVEAGPARREAGEYALEQIRERRYQTLENWLAFYKGRLITENKLWAALSLAIDLNQDVRHLCQRESCKKTSALEKTVRGLAFHLRMHPFTLEEYSAARGTLPDYSQVRYEPPAAIMASVATAKRPFMYVSMCAASCGGISGTKWLRQPSACWRSCGAAWPRNWRNLGRR